MNRDQKACHSCHSTNFTKTRPTITTEGSFSRLDVSAEPPHQSSVSGWTAADDSGDELS